ncbi:MAG: hypothetical protein ACREH9_04620 [Pseudomonadota bacterium]
MAKEDDLHATIDLIYEAVLDDTLWPKALESLGDTIGAAHIVVSAMDRRARKCDSIAPRTDPLMEASYKEYWAFHDPLWPLITARPTGEVFALDSLVPRKDFSATAVYNEWYRQAKVGLAMLGANLRVEDQVFASFFAANAPRNDQISSEQKVIFRAALKHVERAVRIHRELRIRDLDHDTAPDRLEALRQGVMLVDGAAKVLFANAYARALLVPGGALSLQGGCLCSTDGSDTLQQLIASCARKADARDGPGGRISIRRGPRRSLRVTVTPLRAKGAVAELPWLGLRLPVAMVTVSNPAMQKPLN